MFEAQMPPYPRSYGPPPERRVPVPTILQMEAVECGAAALAMVLAHFGRHVPLDELRQKCGVSRDGLYAVDIARAAREYGLEAKGKKVEIDRLYELELPMILHWNFNHFVVLEGFHKGRAYINDPAMGPRSVAMAELDGSFSGVALTLKPGPNFTPGGERRTMRAALSSRLDGYRNALWFVMLCGLFLVIPGVAVPAFSRMFVDEILVGRHTDLIKPLLLGMALTLVIRIGLTGLQQAFLLRMETKLSIARSAFFFQHLLRLPIAYFSQRYAGEVSSRVAINDEVAQLLSGSLTTTLLDCLLVVFYAALMFIYDYQLTAVVLLLAFGNLAVLLWSARARTDVARRLQVEKGKLTGTAMNGLRMIDTLKATGSEGELFERWAGYQAKTLNAEQSLAFLSQIVGMVPMLVNLLTTAAVLFMGGLKVMHGGLTVGMLVAYQSLLASFLKPLNTFVGFGSSVQELEANMNRLDDVLEHPEDASYHRREDVPAEALKMVKLSGHIELRDVTFGYSPPGPLSIPQIKGFNLEVKPGQRVALVGRSGCGKSTVSRLISGLYQPWSGEILFDGMPRTALPHELIANSLAMVDQDIFLFGGSIRHNVTLWDDTIPVGHIARALKDAAIDGVVEAREGTYQARIAEGGINFSGGQRQRLEIARALVGNPTMLVLDEATSALDPTTEAQIDDYLRLRGAACLIIAHRLSTIRDCDQILVMGHGEIVQSGTHDELKGQPGLYAELIRE